MYVLYIKSSEKYKILCHTSSLRNLFYRSEARANKFCIQDDEMNILGQIARYTTNITKWEKVKLSHYRPE